jgi:SSS family solute:Na+ symporter
MATQEDYFLGGRNLGFISLTLTLFAAQLGGGTVLGAAEEAYSRGWIVLLYPLGSCIGMLCLAAGFGALLRTQNLNTVAELFEKIYASKALRKTASVLSIVSLFFILVAQGIAARKFFAALGYSEPILFFGFWAVLILYTVIGGLKAIVNSDILQALFILGSFVLAAVSVFFTDFSALPVSIESIPIPTDSLPWIGWLLMPLLFMLIEQDMGQLCFAAKSPRTVTLASAAAAGVFFLSALCPIFFGVMARDMGLEIPEGTSVLVAAVSELTNPTVTTFFVTAILMAVVSTAVSLLCSISSNLTYDLPFLRGENQKSGVFFSRSLTFATGMLAMGISFFFNNVVDMVILSYELSVYVLFVPVVMAVILNKPSLTAALCSMSSGALGFATFLMFDLPLPKELTVMGISLLGFGVGQLLDQRRFAEKVLNEYIS